MRLRFSPVWSVIGILFVWFHGWITGTARGNSLLTRFYMMTLILVFPVVALWLFSKSLVIRRLAASMALFILSLQATTWALSIAWYRNPKAMTALPDLGHDLLGAKWEGRFNVSIYGMNLFEVESDEVPDIFLTGSLLSAIALALSHDLRWVIIRRFLLVYSMLMFFRCFTMLVTSLPDSHPRCQELTPEGDMPSGGASLELLSTNIYDLTIHSLQVMIPVGVVTCGDMVFSGHTMLIVLSALLWHTYYPRNHGMNPVKLIVWLWSMVGLYTIIATRLHYTLDVALAVYLCLTVWSTYHRISNDVIRKNKFAMVWLLDTLIIYPAVEYFEEGVGEEGLCVGIYMRTVEEENDNPEAYPRRSRTASSISEWAQSVITRRFSSDNETKTNKKRA